MLLLSSCYALSMNTIRILFASALLAMVCHNSEVQADYPLSSNSVTPPSKPGSMAPNITADENGLYLTWIEPGDSEQSVNNSEDKKISQLRFARFTGEGWSKPQTIVAGTDFFANWADLPSIAIAKDGSLYAHWLQKSSGGTYSYDVTVAHSIDGGKSWQTNGPVHKDKTLTEHGFCSMLADAKGIRAFWLDGREMAPEGGGEGGGHGGSGNMTLRTTAINKSNIAPSVLLDARVCECCGTSAAMTDNGPVIVYRSRSDDEIRDIYIVRQVGDSWTKPKAIHNDGWQIAACPVNGPSIAANGKQVAVTWFSMANNQQTVKVIFSYDAGATFGKPVIVDNTQPVGRVDIELLETGEVIVSWLDRNLTSGAVYLQRISPNGQKSQPLEVTQLSASRRVGFPKIGRSGASLVVVWTLDTQPTQLEAVIIDLASIPNISTHD